MISLASTLPENSNDGYVAAAYIVFFALVLIYVAIMAVRLARVERLVRELREAVRHGERAGAHQGEPQDSEREREPV
jgi:hypothetical protein